MNKEKGKVLRPPRSRVLNGSIVLNTYERSTMRTMKTSLFSKFSKHRCTDYFLENYN